MDYICSPLSSQLSRGKNERGKKKHDANFPTLTLFDTHAEQKQTGQQIIVNENLLPYHFFFATEKFAPGENNERGRRTSRINQISPASQRSTAMGN